MKEDELGTMNEQEALQREKAEIWSPDYVPLSLRGDADGGSAAMAKLPVLVAEGDSWFDYLPGKDVLDWLRGQYGYTIHKFSVGGDTLENMVYGTKYRRNFSRYAPGLDEVLEAVRKHQPTGVLLSAGGNDFAGPELMAFLNHRSSPSSAGGADWLRSEDWQKAMQRSASAIEVFAREIWKAHSPAVVVMHGYARPVPDGRAVVNFPFGWKFIGPWLRSSFVAKGYVDWKATEPWIGQLLDDYNTMLSNLSARLGAKFRYVDVRSVVGRNDWANELHPTNPGFARVAGKLHDVLKTL